MTALLLPQIPYMKKVTILSALLLLMLGFAAQAQEMILSDPTTSRTFNSEKYSEVKGTPYFIDKWLEGSVTINKGIYKRLFIKYDVLEQELLFSKDDASYFFSDPVISFVLKPNPSDSTTFMKFIKGLTGNGLKENQFALVLAEGNVSLYRSDIKKSSDLNDINRGVVKQFSTSTRYYIKKDGATNLVKLSKDEILALLKDKETALQQFIDNNKINFKKEGDVAKLIAHYNSL